MTVTERAIRAIAEPPTQEDYLAHLRRNVGPDHATRDSRERPAPQQED